MKEQPHSVPMPALSRTEAAAIERVASAVGTPVYVYSKERLRAQVALFRDAVAKVGRSLNVACYYPLLANANPYLVQIILDELSRAELAPGVLCASQAELRIVQAVSPLPRDWGLIYTDVVLDLQRLDTFFDVVTTRGPTTAALVLQSPRQAGVYIDYLRNAVGGMDTEWRSKVEVGLRVKIDSDAPQPVFSLYHGPNARFGMVTTELCDVINRLHDAVGARAIGFHFYPGTNIKDVGRLTQLYRQLADIIRITLSKTGMCLAFLDIGGGLGFDYADRRVIDPSVVLSELCKMFCNVTPNRERIYLEPGRSLIGPVGLLVTEVVDVIGHSEPFFVVVDAGMSHFSRTYIYRENHAITPLIRRFHEEPAKKCFVVGATMASGDYLLGDPGKEDGAPLLPKPDVGDYLVVHDTGAYGYSMSNNFSGLLRPAEVLIEEEDPERWYILRERETVQLLLAEVPPCLKRPC